MVKERLILERVHELHVVVNKVDHAFHLSLPELFKVGVIIAKLIPS